MMSVKITTDEWLAEVSRLREEIASREPESDGAFTSTEYGDAIGKSSCAARRELVKLVKAGKLVPVMARKRDMWGVLRPKQCYQLKD